MIHYRATLWSALILPAIFSVGLYAQSTNNQQISGLVQDSTGSVVPNATVSVVNTDTNLTRSASSNESGNYVIANLPIGTYRISAEVQGFKKLVLTDVTLSV